MAKKKESKKKSGATDGVALDKESTRRLARLSESTGISPADVIAQALKHWEEQGLTQPASNTQTPNALPTSGQTPNTVQATEQMIQKAHEHLLAQLDKRLSHSSAQPLPDLGEPRRAMNEKERTTLVKEASQLREEGLSWGRIADMFNQRGQPTLSGVGKWHGQTLGHWIRRETTGS
ncbi:hypothetical protein [Magnetococcus sp. PR-3]|uniref:hypothetical protein n=1 Tax=Magnetococcus sp. PR-3 TaxID=3120355 RepID=UPI002FCE0BCF